ncbi:MAG: creatininase family protein [Rhodobiaceae bacterium]|nr:creatininase family protein [Rhodobiaceae bacterium]
MTSEAVGAAASQAVAVLPIAAVEQHGPHLPVGTDLTITEGLVSMLAEKVPDDVPVVFLPPVPFGKSDEHGGFAGTVSLSAETMIAVLTDIGGSLAASGIARLVIVSGHGGNSECMGIAARRLRERYGMAVVATNFMRFGLPDGIVPEDEARFGIHGGMIETSLMLHLAPDQVDMTKAADFASAAQTLAQSNAFLGFSGPGALSWMTSDLNETGAVGNAAAATAEVGQRIADWQSGRLARLIVELAAFVPADPLR